MKLTPSTRPWLAALAAVTVFGFLAADALAQRGRGGRGGPGGRGGRPGNEGEERNEERQEIVSIVRVGDEVQIVPKDEVDALEKGVKTENSEALKAWKARKDEAAKAGAVFEEKKPESKAFKVLAQSIEGRYRAEEAKAEWQQKVLDSLPGDFRVIGVGAEYRVVKKSEVSGLRRDVDAQFRKDREEFEKARRNPDNAGGAGAERPRRGTLKIMPKAFATEKEAQEYAATLSASGPPPGPGRADGERRRRPREGGGEGR